MVDKSFVVAFDLDDVICSRDNENEDIDKYNRCVPNKKFVNIVNSCYDNGNYVIIYTARGMNTRSGNVNNIYNELFLLTKLQLESWGVKHHKLVMGKIHFDILIDDKAVCSNEIKCYDDIIKRLT